MAFGGELREVEDAYRCDNIQHASHVEPASSSVAWKF